MPLYKGKTTIQALGGNRIEWKAQFRVEELGQMLTLKAISTAPMYDRLKYSASRSRINIKPPMVHITRAQDVTKLIQSSLSDTKG